MEGSFVGVGLDDVEGDLAQEGEVLGSVSGAVSGGVFSHRHVERPVEVVLDAPLGARELGEAAERKTPRQDEKPCADGLGAVKGLPDGVDAGERAGAGKGERLFKIGRRDDAGPADLGAVMALIDVADEERRLCLRRAGARPQPEAAAGSP